MSKKIKLVGELIDCIYKNISSESNRSDVYEEFIDILIERDFDSISFLDNCTEDEVFWEAMANRNLADLDIPEEDEEESEQFGLSFEGVFDARDGEDDNFSDDDDEEEE